MSQNGSKAMLGFKGIQSLKSRVMGCGREGKLEQTEHHSGCISVVLGWSIPVSGDETLLLFCEVLLGNTTPKLKSFQRPLARPVIFFFFLTALWTLWDGSSPVLLAVEVWSLNHETTEEAPNNDFLCLGRA